MLSILVIGPIVCFVLWFIWLQLHPDTKRRLGLLPQLPKDANAVIDVSPRRVVVGGEQADRLPVSAELDASSLHSIELLRPTSSAVELVSPNAVSAVAAPAASDADAAAKGTSSNLVPSNDLQTTDAQAQLTRWRSLNLPTP